jgi:hypothetical protein
MNKENGAKNWVFCDGDLPPAGDREPYGHEALMITNLNSDDAHIEIDILFEDHPPHKGIRVTVPAERVRCIRLDKPLGDEGYQIAFGQYSLIVHSPIPVVAVFGRLDVRQPNMAYYSVQGYNF